MASRGKLRRIDAFLDSRWSGRTEQHRVRLSCGHEAWTTGRSGATPEHGYCRHPDCVFGATPPKGVAA
jgi:hypothetical protein